MENDFLPKPTNLVHIYLFLFPIPYVLMGSKALWYKIEYLNEALVIDKPNLVIPIGINLIFLFLIMTTKGEEREVRRSQTFRQLLILGLQVCFAFSQSFIMYYVFIWMILEIIIALVKVIKRSKYLLEVYKTRHTWLKKKEDGSKKYHSKVKAKDLEAKKLEEEAKERERLE